MSGLRNHRHLVDASFPGSLCYLFGIGVWHLFRINGHSVTVKHADPFFHQLYVACYLERFDWRFVFLRGKGCTSGYYPVLTRGSPVLVCGACVQFKAVLAVTFVEYPGAAVLRHIDSVQHFFIVGDRYLNSGFADPFRQWLDILESGNAIHVHEGDA